MYFEIELIYLKELLLFFFQSGNFCVSTKAVVRKLGFFLFLQE